MYRVSYPATINIEGRRYHEVSMEFPDIGVKPYDDCREKKGKDPDPNNDRGPSCSTSGSEISKNQEGFGFEFKHLITPTVFLFSKPINRGFRSTFTLDIFGSEYSSSKILMGNASPISYFKITSTHLINLGNRNAIEVCIINKANACIINNASKKSLMKGGMMEDRLKECMAFNIFRGSFFKIFKSLE